MNLLLRTTPRTLLLGTLGLVAANWAPASAQVLTAVKTSDEIGPTLELADSDLFGYSVDSIGDLNNDGVPDIIVGQPREDDGGVDTGGTILLQMNADGTADAAYPINDNDGLFLGAIDNYDFFGSAVCGIGDLNNDGIEDVAVGSPGDDDGGAGTGAVWILFLKDDFTCDGQTKISDTQGGFDGNLSNGSYFGSSIASIGDIDGDGVTDLAIGSPGYYASGDATGAVWIVMMNTDGTVKDEYEFSNLTPGFSNYFGVGDFFGSSVTGIGDLDGNGTPDVVAGAIRDDDGGEDRGALWTLLLTPSGAAVANYKISNTMGGFNAPLDDYDQFGMALCNLGDQDGDGIADIGVGANGDDDVGSSAGGVYILFLNGTGTVKDYAKILLDELPYTGMIDPMDQYGFDIANAGDINGDGSPDLVVGAPGDDDALGENGVDRGAIYVSVVGDGVLANLEDRNGTGVNRECMAHFSLPRLGQNFQLVNDADGHSLPAYSIIVGYTGPYTITTPFGELLVQTEAFGGAQVFMHIEPVAWGFGIHNLLIPDDPVLEGLELSLQAVLYSSQIELCNAVDIRVGL